MEDNNDDIESKLIVRSPSLSDETPECSWSCVWDEVK